MRNINRGKNPCVIMMWILIVFSRSWVCVPMGRTCQSCNCKIVKKMVSYYAFCENWLCVGKCTTHIATYNLQTRLESLTQKQNQTTSDIFGCRHLNLITLMVILFSLPLRHHWLNIHYIVNHFTSPSWLNHLI